MELNSKWTLWFHSLSENKWDLSSYIKLCYITNIEEFWSVFNNINIKTGMLFLMKDNIPPMWESKENIDGGSWSFMINENSKVEDIFLSICSGVLGCNLLPENEMKSITGVTITPKRNAFIIKIWSSKNNQASIQFNTEYISKETLESIVFKNHKKNLGLNHVKDTGKKFGKNKRM